jgi:hypothetical protein
MSSTLSAMATVDDEQSDRVDQFIVYAAFGEVMHEFQVFELVLWQLQSRSIKPGTTPDQAMDKVHKWNSTTFGGLVRGIKNQDHWPCGIAAELEEAVDARNFLAHHFLREYFLVRPSSSHREVALDQLARISRQLDTLHRTIEAHLRSLGIPGVDDLDDETRNEIEAMRPTSWLSETDVPRPS